MNENWKAKTNYFYYNSTVFLVFVYLSSCPEIRMNLEKRKINVVSREIQVNSNHFLSLKHKTDLGHRVLFAWARWHTWARWCHRAQDHCPIFQSDIYTLTYLSLFKTAFLYFLTQQNRIPFHKLQRRNVKSIFRTVMTSTVWNELLKMM